MFRAAKWAPVALGLVLGSAGIALVASTSLDPGAIDQLAAADPQQRSNAVAELAGGSLTTGQLIAELSEDHGALVKSGIAAAIAKRALSASDVQSLTALVTGASVDVRVLAVQVLGSNPSAGRDALFSRLADARESALVRAAAATALASAGPQARSALQKATKEAEAPAVVRRAALQALARLNADGVQDVCDFIHSAATSVEDREVALRALADAASPSDTALTSFAQNGKTPAVRAAAAAALATRGNATAAGALVMLLGDAFADVRLAALQAIHALGAAAANRNAVIGRLIDGDPRVQALAALLVGMTCQDIASTVKPTLVALLGSANATVRYEAALALWAHGDTSGAATMLGDAGSASVIVARRALLAYSRITGGTK